MNKVEKEIICNKRKEVEKDVIAAVDKAIALLTQFKTSDADIDEIDEAITEIKICMGYDLALDEIENSFDADIAVECS